MSSICDLCDDLLVKILSSLQTKDALATSLLSKRWLSLWTLVPRLEYCAPLQTTGSDFIENFLRLSKAPVLETFHVKLGEDCAPKDHQRWVDIAAARHVRVLELLHYCFHTCPMPCPSTLFTCKGLLVLRLRDLAIYDIPSTLHLHSLKTLSLLLVRFFSKDDLFHRLLSACSTLETLILQQWFRLPATVVPCFTIAHPTLQSLDIMIRPDGDGVLVGDYVINTPSLKTLIFSDKFGLFRSIVKMSKLVKAEIKIRQEDSKNLMGCLTSAKHLSLCLTSNISPLMAKPGAFFCHLEYLELCARCSLDWLCLLLRHSRKLRVLRLNHGTCPWGRVYKDQWEQPCCVPECLESSLETVEWIGYQGSKAEKEVAIYIFDKASHPKYIQLCTLVGLTSMVSPCNECRLEVVPMEQH